MDLGLEGTAALVTGASRGIGRAIAASLASEGCRVAICARGEEGLERAARELGEGGAEVFPFAVDLTEPGGPSRFVEAAVSEFGGLGIVVNNVGGNRRMRFAETEDEDWAAIIDLNVQTHIRTSRAAVPYLREAGGGSIVFISSIFGREAGGEGLSIYNTTKSSLISLAKIMSLELASDGIRVNSVAPGSIRFPGGSWDRRVEEDPEGMARFVEDNIPLGRFGRADEIGDLVAFLVSERGSLITGACLNADGGQSRSLI
ncbi:MAG: SDR family oxidoreductase [bacterium]